MYFSSFQFEICIPVRINHKSNNNPDRFCYIYSNEDIPNRHENITNFVKEAYHDTFVVKEEDQYKVFASTFAVKDALRTWGVLKEW